jgi:hypothetical protein
LFVRHVIPVVGQAWPQVTETEFFSKLRAGFQLYCSLPLAGLVLSPSRPTLVRVAASLAKRLGWTESAMVAHGQLLMPVLFRALVPWTSRRVALAAAWILTLDDAVDGISSATELRAALAGHAAATDAPSLRATAALSREMLRLCKNDKDRDHLQGLFAEVLLWADAEVGSRGPAAKGDGIQHRLQGIHGSIAVLAWAIGTQNGSTWFQFMTKVAILGQIVDDWLDQDIDRSHQLATPVTVGLWTDRDIKGAMEQSAQLLNKLCDENDETRTTRTLVNDTFTGEVQRMMTVLINHP